MTDADPTSPVPLAEQINRKVKAAILLAGHKPADIEHADALNMSHAGAMRRFSGQQEWKLSEIESVATWLDIHPDDILITRPR